MNATRIDCREYWLCAAFSPTVNETLHVRLFPAALKQTTCWVLADLHRRYRFEGVTVLVDDADHSVDVLQAEGSNFEVGGHGSRNVIERGSGEVQRRTSAFSNSFSRVSSTIAESRLEPLAVYHNARQSSRGQKVQ